MQVLNGFPIIGLHKFSLENYNELLEMEKVFSQSKKKRETNKKRKIDIQIF